MLMLAFSLGFLFAIVSTAPSQGHLNTDSLQAMHDYNATTDQEFDLKTGDVIAVMETPWETTWKGELLDRSRRQRGRTEFPSQSQFDIPSVVITILSDSTYGCRAAHHTPIPTSIRNCPFRRCSGVRRRALKLEGAIRREPITGDAIVVYHSTKFKEEAFN
ncbi:hypothetical protein BDV98DRAFT_583838 [Pterulicium gracile]|uniref:SH3 domain-containing protein n=1 Tax=Pterulicium gracile TaxID=1884261 RepID=A0A5C3QE68_9AGAR|nr:hypothetical protein BDV98DRAFT_583838 [Pterula gracilis]